MAPKHKSFTNSTEEQIDIIVGLLAVFMAIVIVIILYLVMRIRGRPSTRSGYDWKNESHENREASIKSERSYNTFSRNTFNIKPKPVLGICSETSSVATSTIWETSAESNARRLECSMKLATNMIEAMHLPTNVCIQEFDRATALKEILWDDRENRAYSLEVFDLIAYDPDIYLKLEEEEFLLENPEPILLVAGALRRFTVSLDGPKVFVRDLKLRFEAGLDLDTM